MQTRPRAKFYQQMTAIGAMTINEVRSLENYPPVGRDVMTTANTIRATFLDINQDYQASDADPWADEADVSERGEEAKDVQFNMAPSHSQVRRLMKLEWFRANPNWVGTFNTNLMGLAAFGERLIGIQYPLFGINSVLKSLISNSSLVKEAFCKGRPFRSSP